MGILDFIFGKPKPIETELNVKGTEWTTIKGIGVATMNKLHELGFANIESLGAHGDYDNLVEVLEGDHLLYFKEGAFKKLYNQAVTFMEENL